MNEKPPKPDKDLICYCEKGCPREEKPNENVVAPAMELVDRGAPLPIILVPFMISVVVALIMFYIF
jgi:hypothetical protein